MIIRKIKIKNFRSYYGDNEFELKDGLTLIIGDNGDGKTTFFEALEWLFNTSTTDVKKSNISAKRRKELDEGESDEVKVSIAFKYEDGDKIVEKSFRFINENGNIILPFDYYDCSIYFWDNKKDKFTALKNESQKCGVINLKNEIVIPFMYDWIERCFSEGKHKGCAIAKLNNKEGIINQKNEIIVPFEYEYMQAMSDDTFLICKKYGEGEYIVDNNFNQISDKKFLEILTGYDHITTDYFIASLDDENKEGLIDKFDNTIIDFKYKDLSMIENPHNKSDFYLYAKNDYDKCGIIDIEENVIVPFEYDYDPAIEIDNDYSAPMAKNGKWGVINIKTNEILVDFVYEDIYSYYNRETTLAKYDGKYGVINKQGQSIKYNLSDVKEIII